MGDELSDQAEDTQRAFDDLGLDLGNCPAIDDCSVSAAILWCAAHQNDNRAESKDAPGASAWVLHEWLSQAPINESSLWTTLFPKLISRSSESPPGPRYKADTTVSDRELARRIVEYGGGPIYEGVDYSRLGGDTGATDALAD